MKFAAILSRFSGVTEESDGGFLALCGSHADSRPSLRIWRGENGTVRVTCRAGCDPDDVIAAADLTWPDMFNATGDGQTVPTERPAGPSASHLAALADYVVAANREFVHAPAGQRAEHEYVSRRFGISYMAAADWGIGFDGPDSTHQFGYRSPTYRRFPRIVVPLYDFNGVAHGAQGRDISGECGSRWVSLSNPRGHRWGAYGVFRGEGGYGVTVVTEGPGDGLTAASLGYDAVVIRGAALAANPDLMKELADGLRGQLVVTAGDNDAAGIRFNRAVADGLRPFGISVRALEIGGESGDISAWREADPTGFPDAFHSAVKGAQPLAAGEGKARTTEVEKRVSDRTGSTSVSSDDGAEALALLGSLTAQYGEASDTLNAYALVAWTNGRIKFAAGLGFYVWNGATWERSETKVRQEIHRMGAALMLGGTDAGRKASRGFTMRGRIDDLMVELRSVPSVHVDASAFDARPDLLAFANGTVELRSGKLRAHDKADLLTYCLEIEYVPTAVCPRWLAFLAEIMPGMPEMPGYLQRLIGYGITGHTSEQCFAVLWGKGANGKSVLTETVTSVFGPVTKTTPFATFEEKQSGGIPNDIAALRGARLVMASEGESGKAMSEAVLKRVTGKDMIAARFLRQEFFEFRPNFLLMLATNHKPKFRGADEGLWRRVKLIEFKRWFAPHERDYTLDAKLLAEAEGIAAWAVAGAVAWYENGLADPAAITEATKEYRETSDTLAGFFPGVIEECDDSVVLNGSDAYNEYRDWCEAEGLKTTEIWSRQAFYNAMGERNVTRKKTAKGIALVGVRVAGATQKAGPGIFM